jgi:hypothetical protein
MKCKLSGDKYVCWHNQPTPSSKDAAIPTRNVVLTDHQATFVEALLRAVQAGVADMDAGLFKTFDSPESLRMHLQSVTAKATASA